MCIDLTKRMITRPHASSAIPFIRKGIKNYAFRYIDKPRQTFIHVLVKKSKEEEEERNYLYHSTPLLSRDNDNKNILTSFICPEQAQNMARLLSEDDNHVIDVVSMSLHEMSYIAKELMHLPMIVIIDSHCALDDKDTIHYNLFYTRNIVGDYDAMAHERTYLEREK